MIATLSACYFRKTNVSITTPTTVAGWGDCANIMRSEIVNEAAVNGWVYNVNMLLSRGTSIKKIEASWQNFDSYAAAKTLVDNADFQVNSDKLFLDNNRDGVGNLELATENKHIYPAAFIHLTLEFTQPDILRQLRPQSEPAEYRRRLTGVLADNVIVKQVLFDLKFNPRIWPGTVVCIQDKDLDCMECMDGNGHKLMFTEEVVVPTAEETWCTWEGSSVVTQQEDIDTLPDSGAGNTDCTDY